MSNLLRVTLELDFSGYDELSFGLRINPSQQMLSLTFLTDNGNGYMAKLDVGSGVCLLLGVEGQRVTSLRDEIREEAYLTLTHEGFAR